MKHPHEEELVLHYYGESQDPAAVARHLRSCPECRRLDQSIRQTLDAVESCPVPERGEAYGRQVWQRLQPRLSRQKAPLSRLAFPPRWALAAAVAFLMLAAFLAGRYWIPAPPEMASISAEGRQRVLLATVGDHLEQARMLLAEMVNTAPEEVLDISSEQELAVDLAEANRFYRRAATQSGHPAVADLLDQLERVLLDIAHSPAQLPAVELEEIQQRIDSGDLLFKLRVMSNAVQRQEKETARALSRQRL